MGHNVGTQAANAVKKGERVRPSERTPEQILKDIRSNLAAKLFVTPGDQRFLLELYDSTFESLQQTANVLDAATALSASQSTMIVELQAQVEQFRLVYDQENRSTTVKIERVAPTESETQVEFQANEDHGGEA